MEDTNQNKNSEKRSFSEFDSNALLAQEYTPEFVTVERDVLAINVLNAIRCGIEYAKDSLAEHDLSLGRTTRKNRVWAENMEADIRKMHEAETWIKHFS